MDNRFTIKDFFLFLLLGGLLVMVGLAMVQYDRQWSLIQALDARIQTQADDLRKLQTAVAKLPGNMVFASAANNGTTTGPSTLTSSTAPAQGGNWFDPNLKDNPFARIVAARQMPGYAEGDWLVNGIAGHVATLTPLISADNYASTIQGEVLETLATRDPGTLKWIGLLAKDWHVSDDGLRITFNIRPDIHFSDGEPLTADDVVFSYEFPMRAEIAAPRQRAYLNQIGKVQKDGPLQVTFIYKEPYFRAFELAAGLPILPKHFYEKFEPDKFNNATGLLMGSGPYKMENPSGWKPGDTIRLVRNERYWGVMPAFKQLVWQEFTNDVARMSAFRNGEIAIFGAFPEQYAGMIHDENLMKRCNSFEYQNPIGGYRYIAWNEKFGNKPSPFADKRVRQAMTLLLDRQRMIKQVLLGYAVISTGPFNPLSDQYNKAVQPWPYDPDKAMQLLADAGFKKDRDGNLTDPDGKSFSFKLTYPSGNANYDKLVLFLKDAYAQAGIALQPDPLEWAVFTTRLKHKDFQAITLGWTSGLETDIYQMFSSDQMVEGGDDFCSYKNEELDKTIDQARHTVDEAKRMELWRKAHAILHEDQPYTFLSFGESLQFVDKRIHNVQRVKLGLNPLEEWFVPADQQKYTQ